MASRERIALIWINVCLLSLQLECANLAAPAVQGSFFRCATCFTTRGRSVGGEPMDFLACLPQGARWRVSKRGRACFNLNHQSRRASRSVSSRPIRSPSLAMLIGAPASSTTGTAMIPWSRRIFAAPRIGVSGPTPLPRSSRRVRSSLGHPVARSRLTVERLPVMACHSRASS
jgi:hypothetical protein